MPNILIVDDDLSMREFLELMLTREGYGVVCARDEEEAIHLLEQNVFDLVLCDIRMRKIDGLQVLRAAKKLQPEVVAVMISAFATTEAAVEAVRDGAYDFIPKPFNVNELRETIKNALERGTLEHEKKVIDARLKETCHFGTIIGNSPEMMKIYGMIRQVA